MKNIIGRLFEHGCMWIDGWSPAHFGFFIQAVLLLGLPTFFCFLCFQRGSRSVFLQTLAFVVGVLLAAAFPVEKMIPRQPILKMWIFTLCLALLIFLPAILPRVLTPELGRQRKLQAILCFILVVLFLANLFIGGSQ